MFYELLNKQSNVNTTPKSNKKMHSVVIFKSDAYRQSVIMKPMNRLHRLIPNPVISYVWTEYFVINLLYSPSPLPKKTCYFYWQVYARIFTTDTGNKPLAYVKHRPFTTSTSNLPQIFQYIPKICTTSVNKISPLTIPD